MAIRPNLYRSVGTWSTANNPYREPKVSSFCSSALLLLAIALLLCSIRVEGEVVIDSSFNTGSGTDWFTEQAVPLPSGKLLVCGLFHTYNGQDTPYLIRLNDDGSLDPTFKTGLFNDWVRHLLVQSDGKIIAMGAFTKVGDVGRNLIARLNEDGSLDSSFNPGLGFEEKMVPADPNPPLIFWGALQADGKIVVVGSFAKFNGNPKSGLARLNPDGTIDDTFEVGSGLDSWGRFVTVQDNGQLLITGWFTHYNGFTCNRMVRLNPDGTPDPAFNPYFGDLTAIYSAALLPDGKMIVSGHTKNDSAFVRHIARLNPDGTEDPTFLAHSNNRTESILIQPDGKILICGFFSDVDGYARYCLARLNADGTLDQAFLANLDDWAWTMAFDQQHRLIVTGMFHKVNGMGAVTLVRLFPDGKATEQQLQAEGKTITLSEDQSVDIALTSVGGKGPVTYSVITPPSKGLLTGTTPNLTYSANPNANGIDSFTFAVTDGLSQSTGTISLNITPVNDPPVAGSSTVDATSGEPVSIKLTATDVDGDQLSFLVQSEPQLGQLSGTPPNLTYTPYPNSTGTDTFTFIAKDSLSQSPPAVINVRIIPGNHAPAVQSTNLTTTPGQAIAVHLNASDIDNDPLTFEITTPPRHGQLSGTSPDLVYLPATGFAGTDSFSYIVTDGKTTSLPGMVTVAITAANHAPTAPDISVSTRQGEPINVVLSSSDADNDPLTYEILSLPTKGQISGTPPGLSYTPNSASSGTDIFHYAVSDGKQRSTTATVTIQIVAQNQPPIATNFSFDTDEDEPISFSLGGFDPEGAKLSYTITSSPTKGKLAGTPPLLTYQPDPKATGVDAFTYVVGDGSFSSAPATVKVNIAAKNHPPFGAPQSAQTFEGTPITLSLNGSDADGDPLTFKIVSSPNHGDLSGTPPAVTYQPAAGFRGQDTFTFSLFDGVFFSTPVTVSVEVMPTNHPPSANSITFNTTRNNSIAVSLSGGDPDSDPISYRIVRSPANGTLTGVPPNLTYTPRSNFNGEDSFTFQTGDSSLWSAEATVTILITFENHPPSATNLTLDVENGKAVSVELVGIDLDGDSVSYVIVSQPSSGTITGTPPHLVYVPDLPSGGIDSFRYVVSDGVSTSQESTVSIVIHPATERPMLGGTVRSNGSSFEISVKGLPNSRFRIECADKVGNWTTLSEGGCDATGSASVVDSTLGRANRFYRAIQL